ncbi:hypothetical protein BT96DRAFT_981236 [Gymnopus androsaceus JB14]|uniref:Uncharacterized protein n=1 Tax=Gymnopus androsaceus JB14 TaxID=1447944 RepID=A0A6A4GRF9_9AGAR|nr:hypothetical protein BT96DRAFT_981236 [Gymnopus androsaceus JB14]
MPEKFVKGLFSTFELRKAMSNAFRNSVRHHPPPSLPLPAEGITGLSKSQIEEFGEAGREVVGARVETFLMDALGLERDSFFSQASPTAVKIVDKNMDKVITSLSECELSKKSVESRTRFFFVHIGRSEAEFSLENIGPMLDLYLDEFPHIFQRWRPVPDDFEGSPQSAIRRTEEFRIPVFRRETASQVDSAVLRRSQRLASRPAKFTAGQQRFFFRKIGELPVTPTKGQKKTTQDALEHPAKRRRLADVSNLLTPSQSISMAPLKANRKPANDESISAAPFKVVKARKQGARERVKRFFGVVDENAVSNGTRSRLKA